MSCLQDSILKIDPSLQELIDSIFNASSLGVMLLAAWRLGRTVAVKIVEAVLAERAQRKTTWPLCPQCGARLHSKGLVERQLNSLIGTICFKRRVGRCPNRCKIGQVAPLDDELGLEPNQQTGPGLKRAACALAVFVPFETASVLLKCLTDLYVSPATVWNWVQAAGKEAMKRLADALLKLESGECPDAHQIDEHTAQLPLILGADGVMVPFRPDGGNPSGVIVWREVKVGILARLGQRLTRAGKKVTQLKQRRLVAVLGDVDALGKRLWLESLRQGILNSETVVWLSDGGRGFWRLFQERFASYATGILDFYHAAQNLWKGASCWLDGRTKQAKQWFAKARRRLRQGEFEYVLANLSETLTLDGLPDAARHTLAKLRNYLENHREHINYKRFKELGLPLGSGMVESACKWLIQQRFKGVGMRWSEDGFNHLLHLRLAWINNQFDELFPLTLSSPNA